MNRINRRSLFGWLAAVPFAGPAIAKALDQPFATGGYVAAAPHPRVGEVPSFTMRGDMIVDGSVSAKDILYDTPVVRTRTEFNEQTGMGIQVTEFSRGERAVLVYTTMDIDLPNGKRRIYRMRAFHGASFDDVFALDDKGVLLRNGEPAIDHIGSASASR